MNRAHLRDTTSPLLTPAQAAEILDLTTRQLAARRRQNTAPKWFVIGLRTIRFDRAAVENVARAASQSRRRRDINQKTILYRDIRSSISRPRTPLRRRPGQRDQR